MTTPSYIIYKVTEGTGGAAPGSAPRRWEPGRRGPRWWPDEQSSTARIQTCFRFTIYRFIRLALGDPEEKKIRITK